MYFKVAPKLIDRPTILYDLRLCGKFLGGEGGGMKISLPLHVKEMICGSFLA